ncbi:MAG: hypothetical protein AB1925_15660 [Actinomycetota bacterium]
MIKHALIITIIVSTFVAIVANQMAARGGVRPSGKAQLYMTPNRWAAHGPTIANVATAISAAAGIAAMLIPSIA